MTEQHCSSCGESSRPGQQQPAGEREEDRIAHQELQTRMGSIKHKILVLSGKGGVGKSTVAVNLAAALAMAGKRVGLLDVDIHGPSVPKLLHIEGTPITGGEHTLYPVKVDYQTGSIRVMSIGFLLHGKDDAVIWRGPRKYGLIKQFLKDVEWGNLDYLVIDSPPGTGDEPLAVAELIGNADGALVVTTPQEVSVQDVRRCIVFCRQMNLPVFGVVENMSGFSCPDCGKHIHIFGTGGGETMAKEMGVPFLGAIPIEPEVVISGDNGTPMVKAYPHSRTAAAFGRIVRLLLEPELTAAASKEMQAKPGVPARIAIPVTNGALSSHFGHCEHFVIFDLDADGKNITSKQQIAPPPHEPGTFPKWLHEQGATIIIAGGMGSRAQSLFNQNDIKVIVGAAGGEPDVIVRNFLDGRLETGANVCDH